MNLETLEIATKRLSNPEYIDRLIIDAVNIHKADLINLIKGQIRVGVKGDGSRTLKYVDDNSAFSPNYYVAKIKRTPAKQSPYRNYENEGDFLGAMFANAKDTEIFVGSTDGKSSFIEDEEDNILFKLTDENKPEFAKIWLPTFAKLLRNELFKWISTG